MIRQTWLGVLLVTSAVPCNGRDLVVDTHDGGDYRAISQAISHARPGDVVTILPGIYREEVLLEGKHGSAEKPIVVRADPDAPPGAVVFDGSRVAPADRWQRFTSERFGVAENHNIWWTRHDPDQDCTGNELMQNCYPYQLHPGWYGWDVSPGGSACWGTCQLFKNGARLQIVPSGSGMTTVAPTARMKMPNWSSIQRNFNTGSSFGYPRDKRRAMSNWPIPCDLPASRSRAVRM